MRFNELTPAQIDRLVHTHIMRKSDELCVDGETNVFMGSYWECTCGWISDFYVGTPGRGTEHNKPIPHYSENMNEVVAVIRRFTVLVYLEWSGLRFMCKISNPVGEPSYGMDANPARAVCIAALKSAGLIDIAGDVVVEV